MAVITYKCPNCGGDLTFDPKSGKYRCEYCLSDFTPEEAEQANPQAAEALQEGEEQTAGGEKLYGQEQEASGQKTTSGEQASGAVVYTCPNCGAEIVTDETTAATYCFYCHNPVVLSGRLSGEYLPDYVLPFAVSREQAVQKFQEFVQKKKFIPRDFFEKEQIKKMTGVYFPYWIYGGDFETDFCAEGKKIRVWRSGDMEFTETSIFDVARQGTIEIDGLVRNALNKADRDLIECVQPYQLDAKKAFSMGYLSGFQAEKRDIEKAAIEEELKKERDAMARQAMKNEASEYTSLSHEKLRISAKKEHWQYVLFPVWTLTYQGRNGKIYYYAMNGQNGNINGDFPVDQKKAVLTSAVCAVIVLIIMLIGGYFL